MLRVGAIFTCLNFVPVMASAHAGHLIEAAGHDHLLAGAAIGIAIAIGVAGALKGAAKREDEAEDTNASDAELSEA